MMALKPDEMDFISNFSTLWQVALGAVLATGGGFAATQMERVISRRERERNSALLFGEVMATALLIMEFAKPARERGDPYGRITMRLLRSVRNEIDIYERNRERLFDLADGNLRARIHSAMVRLSMPLDNIFETSDEIARTSREGAAAAMIAELDAQRELQFNAIVEQAAKLKAILAQLEPLARHSFEGFSEIARGA